MKALITGITGQDGSYLAELLLSRGYEVHGIIRRSSTPNTKNIDGILDRITLHFGDLSDGASLSKIVKLVQPDEVYNLGAQSHVRVSFDTPVYTSDVVGLGVTRLLEAIRHLCPKARFYQASTSELFGSSPPPQNEESSFSPKSPYAISKLYAHWITRNYRESYGLFTCNGILFNHESPRRSENIVSKKITKAVARIKLGLQDKLELGNLDARRDWGYAPEYVEAMWLMLQQKEPDDYAIGTGEDHTVREFLVEAFTQVDLNWENFVIFDERLLRPSEVDILRADYTRAWERLGWAPKAKFNDLIRIMVESDLQEAKNELGK